jgi:hypothetical protein
MSTAIVPGPCPSSGCPAPTQIDCIEVTKVYDSCFQTEDFSHLTARIPCGDDGDDGDHGHHHHDDCMRIAQIPGTTATCTVTSSSCTFVSSTTNAVNDQFVNATFAVSLMQTVTLTSPNGHTCTFDLPPVEFMKTATLCGPSGTTQTCTIAGTTCGPCVIMGDKVFCQLLVCLVLQSVATVQLLVPNYGFCMPTACTVLADPPCPPVAPADCTTSTTSATSMPSWTS